jgi:trigger factor
MVMKLHVEHTKDTLAVFEIEASVSELTKIKTKVLTILAPSVKLAGFRNGKAPLEMVEKALNQQTLQTEFINEAINMLYIAALKEERIRPVDQPKVEVKKFVPYTTLVFKMEIPVIGKFKLPNYKKHGVTRPKINVDAKAVNEVLENLQTRSSDKKEVNRPAKMGDEALIDFKGIDEKGKAVEGAEGKDYPLILGSKAFIPGFEEGVVGMKVGDKKDIKLKFPKNYGSKDLQNKKVTFKVNLKKLYELTKPKLDDKFASTVGPFENLKQLKDDIKTQLTHDSKQRAERDYEANIVNELVAKIKVAIPESLIQEQQEIILQEVRQRVVQRGTTFQEFLKQAGTTEERYIKDEVKPEAERRVKAGLLLSEIADAENIDVTPEELELRIQQLKGQYKDAKMQEELDKDENRREINARIRSEKVINFLKN